MTSGSDPETIGPFRILRQIGEGGMGLVYEALQTEPVRRHVALKILRPHDAGNSVAARFAAEQQALALMDHPGIAKVFDAGTTEDGRQWFAMELVHGTSLTDYADAHGLDIPARVQLFARVCRAVQHAHQKGVIHRDLKPSNVLVTEHDNAPAPKIIDFGIAKAVGLRLTDTTLVTQFGVVIGTPAYMSPEQAEGTMLDIDTRSDIYSLGVMLYELLVSCLPVDPQEMGYAGFIAYLMTRDVDPPTPSTRYHTLDPARKRSAAHERGTSPARLREHLAGDLDWIVMAALEKDRNRRYESAGALATDLERYLRHEPISARPPSAVYQMRRFVSRHRVAVAATAVVAVALALGAVAATVGMVRARREAAIASAVSDFMSGLFVQNDPNRTGGRQMTVRQVLDQAAKQIDTGLAGQPLVQARLMQSIGDAYRGMGLFATAKPMLEGALSRAQRMGTDPLEIAGMQADLGYLLIFTSDFGRAESLLRTALATYRRRLGDGDRLTATTLENLVFLSLRSQRNLAEGEAMLREALPVERAAMGESPEVAETMYLHCWTLRELGRIVASDSVCEASLALLRRLYHDDRPIIAYNLLSVGHTRRMLGRYRDALAAYREALAMNRRLYPDGHAETGYALQSIASTYAAMGRPDSALPYAQQAAAMLRRALHPGATEVAPALVTLGGVLTDLRRFVQADAQYREALAIDSAGLGIENRRVGIHLIDRGQMELQRGRYRRADSLIVRGLGILRQTDVAGGSTLISPLDAAAQSAYRMGDRARAEALLREAMGTAERAPADHPLPYAVVRVDLARVLTETGDLDTACALADSARADLVHILGPDHWRVARAESVLGQCLSRAGHQAEAEHALREAYQRLQAARLPGDLFRRDAAAYLVEFYERTGRAAEARRSRADLAREEASGQAS
jgi:serine/threonine protein kinase/tetratricopeptide (TPR) repeat protein